MFDQFQQSTHLEIDERANYNCKLIRMEEMRQSIRVMKQCVTKLRNPGGRVPSRSSTRWMRPKRGEIQKSVEALIPHFKLYTEGVFVTVGEGGGPLMANRRLASPQHRPKEFSLPVGRADRLIARYPEGGQVSALSPRCGTKHGPQIDRQLSESVGDCTRLTGAEGGEKDVSPQRQSCGRE